MTNLLKVPPDTKQSQINTPINNPNPNPNPNLNLNNNDIDEESLPPPPEYEEIDSNPQLQSPPFVSVSNNNNSGSSSTSPNYTGGSSSFVPNYNHSGSSSINSPIPNNNYTSNNSNSHNTPHHSNTSSSNLPWKYPKRFYCKECKNTGYKLSKFRGKEKRCSDCWNRFYKPVPQVYKPPKPVPVTTLPPGTTYIGGGPGIPTVGGYGMPPAAPFRPNSRPLILKPGDPRIGGSLCPGCGGKGLVRFFLDSETCTTCNGIGRVMY